ncbi:protein of unknown function [Burkholderia multivorans]
MIQAKRPIRQGVESTGNCFLHLLCKLNFLFRCQKRILGYRTIVDAKRIISVGEQFLEMQDSTVDLCFFVNGFHGIDEYFKVVARDH